MAPCHLAPHWAHLQRHLVCPVHGTGDLAVLGHHGEEVVAPPIPPGIVGPVPTIGKEGDDFRGLVPNLLLRAHLDQVLHTVVLPGLTRLNSEGARLNR